MTFLIQIFRAEPAGLCSPRLLSSASSFADLDSYSKRLLFFSWSCSLNLSPGTFSYWKVEFFFISSCLTAACRFYIRRDWCLVHSIIPSILMRAPVPAEEKQLLHVMRPSPCVWCSVDDYYSDCSVNTMVSSDQNTFCFDVMMMWWCWLPSLWSRPVKWPALIICSSSSLKVAVGLSAAFLISFLLIHQSVPLWWHYVIPFTPHVEDGLQHCLYIWG